MPLALPLTVRVLTAEPAVLEHHSLGGEVVAEAETAEPETVLAMACWYVFKLSHVMGSLAVEGISGEDRCGPLKQARKFVRMGLT